MLRGTVLALALYLTAVQQPGPHDLAYCINHGDDPNEPMTPPHACTCHQSCDPLDDEDKTCKTYCAADHCHCVQDCGEDT